MMLIETGLNRKGKQIRKEAHVELIYGSLIVYMAQENVNLDHAGYNGLQGIVDLLIWNSATPM